VPEPYLNQILTLLRKAGLIGSRRGPGGGHALARASIEITLADIVAALEGPLWTAESTATRDGRDVGLADIWREVDTAIYAILLRITLADLVERSRRKAYSYQI
jgi:Rrf2 family protein